MRRLLHPDLRVEMLTDVGTASLERRDADLAVRLVRPERGHLTVRRLGTLGLTQQPQQRQRIGQVGFVGEHACLHELPVKLA